MAVLSDSGILALLKNGELSIDPFSEACLSPAGYDVRSADGAEIPSRGQALISTVERVSLGPSLCGQILLRSSFAREGLIGSFALIDPGFRGQLTLSLANLGPEPVRISPGERVAQVVFMKLETPPMRLYSGRYQDSAGTVGSRRFF